jgi:hypothetical protein
MINCIAAYSSAFLMRRMTFLAGAAPSAAAFVARFGAAAALAA